MSPAFTKDPWAAMLPHQSNGDLNDSAHYDPHMGKPGPGQPARDPFPDAREKFMRGLG